MITIDMLERWLTVPAENERLEFKEARQQYDTTKLLKYCTALSNEGGGRFILGVTNKPPSRWWELPAPDFRAGHSRTTTILFAHQTFSDMSKSDRIRACYQHCALLYVSNDRMSNQSLRNRFGLDESPSSSSTASQVIAATRDAGFIKSDDDESGSTRYAHYLPWWA